MYRCGRKTGIIMGRSDTYTSFALMTIPNSRVRGNDTIRDLSFPRTRESSHVSEPIMSLEMVQNITN